jgi:hypothetical protein
LWHVKDPYNDVEVAIVGKITGNLAPKVPLSLLEVSRVVLDVGATGGVSGNFQSRVSIINLMAVVNCGGVSRRGPARRRRRRRRRTKYIVVSDLYINKAVQRV